MCKKYKIFLAAILCSFVFSSGVYADESTLFTSVAPDALIVLDLSGSMLYAPVGNTTYTLNASKCNGYSDPHYASPDSVNHPYECPISCYSSPPKWCADEACSSSFYRSSGTGHTIDCSRVAIAKRAIFDILDDNDDDIVDDQDEVSLNIRIGYMRFYNGDDTGGNYSSGNNILMTAIGFNYSDIWSSVSGANANSGTPLVSSLNEAKLYLDYHKSKDKAGACRQKFVILIADGEGTYSCSGNGSSGQTDQYKRRRETVAKAKALADAGYKVFVVGFGSDMPYWLKNTLNWAAYYGNTDNPEAANSGDTTAYDPDSVTSCQTSSYSYGTTVAGAPDHYYADSNDPGELTLNGYAFLASSASELTDALKQAINIIREATYSFSMASIQTSRTTDENYLYEASFEPVNNDPFWLGHLKKYSINTDGTVGSVAVWDAGSVLQLASASGRTIYTYKSGSLTTFTTSNITKEDLDADTDAERDAVVGYIRGEDAYNPDNWKLGDIFRSAPVTIATPSSFFCDTRDTNDSFSAFRTNNERISANGKRTIIVGANDGQIHAFNTFSGGESWSFIPPNLLPKLKYVAHSSHPTGLTHQYFVDGPSTVADVWLGTGDGTAKSASDWKTLLVFGEGRGGTSRLWSSSSSCDSGFNATYSTTYPYYGGYYCLDVTNPLSPVYKWRINPNSSDAPYVGDPWCKVFPGKVKISGNEKWVGFLGGGYNAQDCSNPSKCDERGKGFFFIDLSNGNILKSFTLANTSSMKYSIPATAAIVDTDNDGFIDTAYVGDLGGNMWRFELCTSADGSSCASSDWSASLLFGSSSGVIRPTYTAPAVSRDSHGNLWVYWGTGDKTDPTAAAAQEKFYAVKDNDRLTTWGISDLENITSGTYDSSSASPGWYINFAGQGEKVLAEPTVFGGVVYFTTFTPDQSGDPCSYGGDAKLYGVDSVSGGGVLSESGDRSITIGTGIPTAPVISLKPGAGLSPDLYVTVSTGGEGGGSSTMRVNFEPPTLANRTNMLFWLDRRLQ